MKAFAQEITADTSTASVSADTLQHVGGELSLLGLFLQADIIVKGVMAILLLISVYCWMIIIEKWRMMARLQKRARRFRQLLSKADSWHVLYEQIGEPRDPLSAVFIALSEESLSRRKGQSQQSTSLMDNIIQPLHHITEVTCRRQSDLLERGLGFLATTASAAPFIGLFGTVWGIMNSFSSIAASNQTSLVVVAPGIAEALFATALGLVAAIPASIAYNKFGDDIARYMSDVENFAYEFSLSLKEQWEQPNGSPGGSPKTRSG